MKRHALLVCPVHPARQQLVEAVRQARTTHLVTSNVGKAIEALKNGKYDVIVTGKKLDDGNADDVLQVVQAIHPSVPVVVVSRTEDWNEYVNAVNRGAFDLLPADSPTHESARVISAALRAANGSP